jgi:hypothetical protein
MRYRQTDSNSQTVYSAILRYLKTRTSGTLGLVQLNGAIKGSDWLASEACLGITKDATKSIAIHRYSTRACDHFYADVRHEAATNEYFWEMTA